MAKTFNDLATLKEFSETYPRASWSPEIYNKYKKVYNIYLHSDLDSVEGRGISITAAKAYAIRMYYSIVSSKNMTNNYYEPSDYLGNTSHFAEDTQPSDCSKNAESTSSSTETLDHIDQHFKNDRLRLLRDFEKSYNLLCHWSSINNQSSNTCSAKIALNIGDYRFEGSGHTEDEAKLVAVKKFYSSPVDNFFEISNQNNETETLVTLDNTPSNDQGNISHCADTKPSDGCDNLVPMKSSKEPGISPFLQNCTDENNTAPYTFMETYNLRNSIWSPFYLVGKQPTVNKNFKVILRIGSKKFQGQGFKKCNAQLNAVKKFKNNILYTHKESKKTTFIENVRMIGNKLNSKDKS